MTRPSALVLYHYLYPDDVISAIHLSELCAGLAARGWHVVGSCCNRGMRDERQTYPQRSTWQGVEFRRIWRPRLRQASGLGRLVNAVWMTAAWSLLAFHPRLRPDVVIVGTDPIFSPLAAMVWKLVRPRVRVAHWCFDLYPEAAVADGLVRESSAVVRLLKWLLRYAYGRFDLMVDIGGCMRRRLARYGSPAAIQTIVPWALVEPEEPLPAAGQARHELFGDSRLALLYSGNFGRAHSWEGIPELASALQPGGGRIVFTVRGNAVPQLRQAAEGSPLGFADFASADQLAARLSAADVHIVTLHEAWTGTVVPSKFFGALAIGRPVLFVGSADSAIAAWIRDFGVGWVLDPARVSEIAQELERWSRSAEAKARLFHHCHTVYRQEFSRSRSLERWDQAMRALLPGHKLSEGALTALSS